MQNRPYNNNNRRNSKDKEEHRINEAIREREVRLTGDNVPNGVFPIAKALSIAEKEGLDLVEIAPNAKPPVCRVIDYQKFVYEQKKREKEQRAKATKVVIKEVRFGPQTDDHDYNFKLKHARSFIEDGAKVRTYVFFRGRSIVFKDQGEELLLRLATDLKDVAQVESMPSMEGKRMYMILAPLRAGSKKNKSENKQTGEES
ncbi:translation initiation factor IF-3 [Bacteroidales bacterium KA00251]|nr:translation initiation factor IF-3 [Bacteroidales bacterium KA00251]